jgi:hypothetical protein
VVGLFPTAGIALDAFHRLHTQGFAMARIAYRVLQEVAPIAPPVAAELEASHVDALVFGYARNTFARFIHNGETAVFVQTESDHEAGAAADILQLYAPLASRRWPTAAAAGQPRTARPCGADRLAIAPRGSAGSAR